MVEIKDCLLEYTANLDSKEKEAFESLMNEVSFLEKAENAIKQVGIFLALVQIDGDLLSEQSRMELSKMSKKMTSDTRDEPKAITSMRMFYLKNYKEILDDVDEEDMPTIEKKINQIIEQIEVRVTQNS